MRFILNKTNKVSLLLTLVIFCQNPIWPIWKSGMVISFIIVFTIFIYLTGLKRRKIHLTPFQWYIALLSLIVFVGVPLIKSEIKLSSIVTILSIVIAYLLNKSEKIYTIKYVTIVFSIIILFSFPFWIFDQFVRPLPIYNFIDLSKMKGAPTIMENHFFFVKYPDINFNRFYSVFDEPGVLGTLSAFVLFANQYNLKKRAVVIILIGSLFTYSLAFYVLTFIGYLFFLFFKKKTKGVLSFVILISVLGLVYTSNKEFSQNPLFHRFQNLDQQLDKRSSENLQNFFNDFIKSRDAFFGKGSSFISESNSFSGASYILFLIEYGIIGAISLLLIYLSLIRKRNRFSYFLLFFFFLSFLQRPGAFTAWQILLFTCSIPVIEKSLNRDSKLLHD